MLLCLSFQIITYFCARIYQKELLLNRLIQHNARRLLTLLLLICSLGVSAQETYLYAERDTCSLYLDIFRPDSSAQTTFKGIAKPAVMFVFGGGFSSGRRSDPAVRGWFQRLNANGYTVVAIDYRLAMKGYRVKKTPRGALKAMRRFLLSQQVGVEDVFSAVSFLAAHPELNVPADNIVIAGSSAGAIISLSCAWAIANGHTEGLPQGFAFKGVMSFAGGIISKSGAPKFPTPPCPLLLFHGTADRVVSYTHMGFPRHGIWGSNYLAKRLKENGCNYSIWRIDGLGHEVAAYMDAMWDVEQDFLEKNVMQGIPCRVDALVNDPTLPRWDRWRKAKTTDLYK